MATTLQKGLFGGDPVAMQREEQKMWSQMYGQAGSPYEKMGIALGQLGGAIFGGESSMSSKTTAINKALEQAGAQYQQGTAEYYKAVADALPAEYADSKEFAMQKFLETKAKNQEIFIASSNAVAKNPELVGEFTAPLAASLLAKAEAAGWDKTKTPVPTTSAEISAFAKEFNLTRDPDYGRYISLTKLAEKEAGKEVTEAEIKKLTIEEKKASISRSKQLLSEGSKSADAANEFFRINNIDPTKPLEPQLTSEQKVFAMPAMFAAQRKALEARRPSSPASPVVNPGGSQTGWGATVVTPPRR